MHQKIFLSPPHMSGQEISYINEAFDTNWIAPLGPNVDAFEQEFAEYVGAKGAAALSSGTAAIHLALELLETKKDDIVFCSSFTFVASVNPILYQGATPVLIDSEPESWNMSPAALERAFLDVERTGKRPKAVIVVNLYGQSADMKPILALCEKYNTPCIEDAAESLGATYNGKQSGSFGKLGIYSFNGNKIITTSGGGMLVSDDLELIQKAKYLATQAKESLSYYQHNAVGYNYRLSNVLAGIGRAQLQVLNDRISARRNIFARYQLELQNIPAIQWMPEMPANRSTRWLSVMLIDQSQSTVTPMQLITCLEQQNIESRCVWKPMHQQPIFKHLEYYSHKKTLSCSDNFFAQGVCLPSGSNLTAEQQQKVIKSIQQVFMNND